MLSDPDAGKYTGGSGFHLYLGEITALSTVHDAFPNKDIFFTEQMVVPRRGATGLEIAEPVARIVIGATTNWARNVLLWNLAADPENGPHTNQGGCPVCSGAITLDGDKVTRNLAYYVTAHFTQFVPSGSVRIASSSRRPGSAQCRVPHASWRTRTCGQQHNGKRSAVLDRLQTPLRRSEIACGRGRHLHVVTLVRIALECQPKLCLAWEIKR